LCNLNPLKKIVFLEATIKEINCKESIFLKFSKPGICDGGGEFFRLEKGKDVVEIIGEVLEWKSSKLGSSNHSSLEQANLGVHHCEKGQ